MDAKETFKLLSRSVRRNMDSLHTKCGGRQIAIRLAHIGCAIEEIRPTMANRRRRLSALHLEGAKILRWQLKRGAPDRAAVMRAHRACMNAARQNREFMQAGAS